jgi:hypothetical protein
MRHAPPPPSEPGRVARSVLRGAPRPDRTRAPAPAALPRRGRGDSRSPGSLGDRSGGGTSPSTWRTAVEAASDPRCALERSGSPERRRPPRRCRHRSLERDRRRPDGRSSAAHAGRRPRAAPADRPSPRRPSARALRVRPCRHLVFPSSRTRARSGARGTAPPATRRPSTPRPSRGSGRRRSAG